MNLQYLRQFLDLAKCQNMTQYAALANVTHAQVSRMVRELEKEYGKRLLIREKAQTTIKLTRYGETLTKRLPLVFNELQNIEALLKNDEEADGGMFDLYTTSMLVDYWISPKIGEFRRQYPLINLNLFGREDSPTVEERKTLFCVSPQTDEHPDIKQDHLKDFHIGLWASKEYLKKNGTPEHVSDLSRHILICFERKWADHAYPTMNWYMNNTSFPLNPHNIIVIKSSVGIMNAAKAGVGIFSLSEEGIKSLGMEFERVLPDISGPVVPMCFSYPTSWANHRSVKRISEFLIELFQKV